MLSIIAQCLNARRINKIVQRVQRFGIGIAFALRRCESWPWSSAPAAVGPC